MKSIIRFLWTVVVMSITYSSYAQTQNFRVNFPKGYQVGDVVEFVKLNPINAGSSGYYEVSISYVRGNMAAASTHIVSVTHFNPKVWKEAGKINSNPYVRSGLLNFTIDCNTEGYNSVLRVRAIETHGDQSYDLPVDIKVRAIGHDSGMQAIEVRGHENAQIGLLPMTDEWDLIVGNNFSEASGVRAIKAISNGNVGIGTAHPDEKLTVKGKIRAQEVKVEANNWPDYVFEKDYSLRTIPELAAYIAQHGHLPEIPKATDVESDGLSLGEMNKLLLKKVEELTLYLIKQNTEIEKLKARPKL